MDQFSTDGMHTVLQVIEHKEIKVDDFVKQRCFIYLKTIKNKKLCTSILSSKKSNFHQLGAKKQKNCYNFLQKFDHYQGWLKQTAMIFCKRLIMTKVGWRKINSYDPLRRLPHQLSDAQKLRKTTALRKSTILSMKFLDLKE